MLSITFSVDQSGAVFPRYEDCYSLFSKHAAYLSARRQFARVRQQVIQHLGRAKVTNGDGQDDCADARLVWKYSHELRKALWARNHYKLASLKLQKEAMAPSSQAGSGITTQMDRYLAVDNIVMARIIDCEVNVGLRSLWPRVSALAASGIARGVVHNFGYADFPHPPLDSCCEDRPPRAGSELGSLETAQRKMVEFLATLGLRPAFQGSGDFDCALLMDLPPAVSQSGWAPLKQIRVLGRVVY
jgi:hypothetical protein